MPTWNIDNYWNNLKSYKVDRNLKYELISRTDNGIPVKLRILITRDTH